MSSEISIKVENLSKCYQIYEQPRDRLKQFVMPPLQRTMGQPAKQYFREFWALRDVSFEVRKGETVGIIGRNGSGKSTLLQMICGTLQPTSGSVTTSGRIAALLELGSGFNPEFSGRENVYMNAGILGLSKSEIDARYDAILEFAEIGEFIEQPVKTYSSGMYVRLAFAVIANVDADILVIDEALAVGDIFFTQKCMRFLAEFKKRGTILFVTHDTNSVMSLCERAVWLQAGDRKAYSDSKTVCQSYLAEYYASSGSAQTLSEPKVHSVHAIEDYRDVRQDFINASVIRNDLEVFKFSNDGEKFGLSKAHIVDVYLESESGAPISWFVGGELVALVVKVHAEVQLDQPIVGFLVKDKNGQHLFGDNTYLSYVDDVVSFSGGSDFAATFKFRMPMMPAGDYTIGVAIANGTQTNHVIHSWVHDAIAFKSHSTSVSTGLVGIPMIDIELQKNG
ncbi:ABC transporter ATP-binding protein [Pseudomonas sp. A-B-26]|uniref:ABC transporter ATP-binding protein n=1 Tax=Pseudomonas sp. A-B-26 TaxID=2832406 RepID=UPI001CC03074|nr:ABC transporter ATP-binding protein [Pseudomonas sp. A-B-26]